MGKLIIIIAAIIYVVSPVDLFPGPIDDAIVSGVAMVILRFFGSSSGGNNMTRT